MPGAAITLRVSCGGMRWRLAEWDRVDVYRGSTLLGTLTGRALALLVEHPLLAAEIGRWPVVLAEDQPTAPESLPVVEDVVEDRRPLDRAPSRLPFTAAQRADQKAQRRTRGPKRTAFGTG